MARLFLAILGLGVALFSSPARGADERDGALAVGLYASPPFAFEAESGRYSGLAVELWEMVAQGQGLKSDYVIYSSLGKLLDDARAGDVDIIVGNLTVTHERVSYLKFSFPWYDDGLRILVKSRARPLSTWGVLRERGHLSNYAWIVALVLLLTVAQAALRWRRDADFPRGRLEGISFSLYEVVRAAKSGVWQKNVLGWAGHIVLTVWMLCGFGLLAYVNSTLTSAMTASSIRQEGINSLNDLGGKRVGVLEHSAGRKYMLDAPVRLLAFETFESAAEALMDDEVDAVVTDAAAVEFWVHSRPGADVEVVGNIFNPYKYSFAAGKKHARLMDEASEEVIRRLDDGTVERLKNKYFGPMRF